MTEYDLDKVKEKIGADIKELLPDNTLRNFVFGNSKYIRSKIGILYSKIFSEKLPDEIYEVLAVTELIHNSSLLHDDVIDDAESRRNNPTIGKLFSPQVSVLSGDYLVSVAIVKLIKLNNSEISKIYLKTVQNMTEAEIQQFFIRDSIPQLEVYLKICEGKTAALFSAMLESCAILLKSDQTLAKKLGKTFGTIYQINNDMNNSSRIQDKKNHISTAIDIMGIEKTNILLDNYKQTLSEFLNELPDNNYKKKLEELTGSL